MIDGDAIGRAPSDRGEVKPGSKRRRAPLPSISEILRRPPSTWRPRVVEATDAAAATGGTDQLPLPL